MQNCFTRQYAFLLSLRKMKSFRSYRHVSLNLRIESSIEICISRFVQNNRKLCTYIIIFTNNYNVMCEYVCLMKLYISSVCMHNAAHE